MVGKEALTNKAMAVLIVESELGSCLLGLFGTSGTAIMYHCEPHRPLLVGYIIILEAQL